jgi:UDP-3-O-[3-hydroxymyristoyl] glucosamine N-acyltransferase
MKFQSVLFKEIATIINCEYVGDANFPVTGMNSCCCEQGDMFCRSSKYYDKALNQQRLFN